MLERILCLFKKDPERARQKRSYPRRIAQFDFTHYGELYVIDNRVTRLRMPELPEAFAFLESDGMHNEREMLKILKKQEDSPIRSEIQLQVALNNLEHQGFIIRATKKEPLPYYLENAMSSLRQDWAIKLMKKDGFVADEP